MVESLGFVDCDGLSGALVAADRMLKTANIKLSGIQKTIGIDWVTVKISGDLSAVTVAVETIKQTMPNVYVSSTVIGSPSKGTNEFGDTNIDLFEQKNAEATPSTTRQPQKTEKVVDEKDPSTKLAIDKQALEEPITKPAVHDSTTDDQTDNQKVESDDQQDDVDDDSDNGQDKPQVTCNLCGDPKCPRKLGEPHKKCIHYEELKNKKNK